MLELHTAVFRIMTVGPARSDGHRHRELSDAGRLLPAHLLQGLLKPMDRALSRLPPMQGTQIQCLLPDRLQWLLSIPARAPAVSVADKVAGCSTQSITELVTSMMTVTILQGHIQGYLYNIRSETDFKERHLPPLPPRQAVDTSYAYGSGPAIVDLHRQQRQQQRAAAGTAARRSRWDDSAPQQPHQPRPSQTSQVSLHAYV